MEHAAVVDKMAHGRLRGEGGAFLLAREDLAFAFDERYAADMPVDLYLVYLYSRIFKRT